MRYSPFLMSFAFILFLTACGTEKKQEDAPKDLKLVAASFADLPEWNKDDLLTLAPAFEKSCARIMRAPADRSFGALEAAGKHSDWRAPCEAFAGISKDSTSLRRFFETYFTPHTVRAGNNPIGLFTGYYEASLKGSRTRGGQYQIPLYTRADDLVMVDLGQFRDELKGQRIAGRVVDGSLKPYETRTEIVSGRWPHNDKILVWVDDAVDAFFVQIQGSGIVELSEGGTMRIGYAGQNGHPYYAIGRELIKRGALTKENVSMQSIREWLAANPAQADEIMNTNKSYVFFEEIMGEGPIGGENIALTPARSLAIDRSLLSYGLPMWVDIDPPVPNSGRLQRLMMAQDTGGAIRGAVRGDVFWGHGDRAEAMAGPMKSDGRYWVLLPKK
ncbi:MAG: murein transglycosylase A [Micavibrio sp.]|nr:murein transglycosylase A [Micavibrio sp.]